MLLKEAQLEARLKWLLKRKPKLSPVIYRQLQGTWLFTNGSRIEFAGPSEGEIKSTFTVPMTFDEEP